MAVLSCVLVHWCAVSVHMRSPHRGKWSRTVYHLGQLTHLEKKFKRETSMSVKQESMKVGNVVVPASPVRMVKPGLVEP